MARGIAVRLAGSMLVGGLVISSCAELGLPGPTTQLSSSAQADVTPLPPGVLPDTPASAPLPSQDMAAISGVLYSFTISQAIAGTGFYLTPAELTVQNGAGMLLTGPHEDAGDIVGRSEDNGQFALYNIPPGEYYMVVWAPYSWSVSQVSAQDQSPLRINLAANESRALGVVYTSWP